MSWREGWGDEVYLERMDHVVPNLCSAGVLHVGTTGPHRVACQPADPGTWLPGPQTAPSAPHSCRSCLLQADSERLLHRWVSAVQSSIASAFSQARLDDSPRGPGQVPSRGRCRERGSPGRGGPPLPQAPGPVSLPLSPPGLGIPGFGLLSYPGLWRDGPGQGARWRGARGRPGAGRGRQCPVLRLPRASPRVGQHQPGRHPLHRVLWHPQVTPRHPRGGPTPSCWGRGRGPAEAQRAGSTLPPTLPWLTQGTVSWSCPRSLLA